ncbi:PREDICTED: vang-like protein 2 [Priapulus caudatus]|uniref:Vang-like protein 2 n=1 Tax=Priapulus caudatus TaxID=37621 RepID=A0ABM1FA78_PRICU|nr:PREDICTED: vang-like protein 2 [Priapulus caudatus]
MDVESVRSGHSERSNHSRRSHGSSGKHRRHGSHGRTKRTVRVNMGDADSSRMGEEMIEVQIIPQDDNWGENTTCITGNTSEAGGSFEDISKLSRDFDGGAGGGDRERAFRCAQFVGTSLAAVLAAFAFLTPVAFVLLPEFIDVPGLEQISCDAACEGLLMSLAFKLVIIIIIIIIVVVVVVYSCDAACEGLLMSLAFKLVIIIIIIIIVVVVVVYSCDAACEGLLMSLAFKLVILGIGAWAVFYRRPKATMPRVFVLRGIVLVFTFIFTFCYWLFFGVRILAGQPGYGGAPDLAVAAAAASDYYDADAVADAVAGLRRADAYHKVVQFAATFVDALLFVHYLAVVLIELRQLRTAYTVTVVRSPDGERRAYNVGQLSVQRAAAWLLEQYYRDFAAYNPYLDRAPSRRGKGDVPTTFKFYDIDGAGNNSLQGRSRAIMAASARRRDMSHNESPIDRALREHCRFFEGAVSYEANVVNVVLRECSEMVSTDPERKPSRDRPAIPMDPTEAAQAVFPSLARALQKYLRVTRQQPYYTLEAILEHLAICISHDMSPKAFLERYLQPCPAIFNEREYSRVQTWALVSDVAPSAALADGVVFQLKSGVGDVALLVHVRRVPHFNITEEVIDPKNNKFVLRLNSETSV